jgi:hypothetical protein
MEDLAGVGPRGEDRVVAEHLGVAVGGTGLELAEDLTDRRVDVDHQLVLTGARPQIPGAMEGIADHLFELADVTEAEGTQERPERGRRHHAVPQHAVRGPGAQHVGVIDVGGTGHHGVDQGQDLAARSESTGATHEPDGLVA